MFDLVIVRFMKELDSLLQSFGLTLKNGDDALFVARKLFWLNRGNHDRTVEDLGSVFEFEIGEGFFEENGRVDLRRAFYTWVLENVRSYFRTTGLEPDNRSAKLIREAEGIIDA